MIPSTIEHALDQLGASFFSTFMLHNLAYCTSFKKTVMQCVLILLIVLQKEI